MKDELAEQEVALLTDAGFDGRWSLLTRLLLIAKNQTSLRLDLPWALTPQHYRCPICHRSKAEIVQLTKNGLLATLHVHHDHMFDLVQAKAKDYPYIDFYGLVRQLVRFKSEPICSPCNFVDARIKRRWREIHPSFSFDFAEISHTIIKPKSQRHKIDYRLGREIWCRQREEFLERLAELGRKGNTEPTPARVFQHHEEFYEKAKQRFYTTLGEGVSASAYSDFITYSTCRAN